jgi:hypothetical protein
MERRKNFFYIWQWTLAEQQRCEMNIGLDSLTKARNNGHLIALSIYVSIAINVADRFSLTIMFSFEMIKPSKTLDERSFKRS